MLWNLTAEARKHRAYREVWVGLALGLGFLALQTLLYGDSMPMWYTVQQDIWSFGGIVAAFTVCVTLPRVFCCEEEQHTSPLLRTAAQGP